MTEPAAEANRERPGLAEAFDWRAGRTWGVFLGSALGTGIAVAATVLVVLAIVTDGPSGDVSWGRVVLGITVWAICWVAIAAVLRVGSEARPRGKVDTARAVLGWAIPTWVRSWLNFLPLGLWIALALLPLLAMHQVLAGRSGGIWEGMDEHNFLLHLFIAVLAVTYLSEYLPALLHHLARPKAPPAPRSPDQAGASRERQP